MNKVLWGKLSRFLIVLIYMIMISVSFILLIFFPNLIFSESDLPTFNQQLVSTIPKTYLEKIDFPFNSKIVIHSISPTLNIKGKMELPFPVMMGTTLFKKSKDNAFSFDIGLKQNKKVMLLTSFIVSSDAYVTLPLTVIRLKVPPDFSQYANTKFKEAYLSFFNQNFFYNPDQKRQLSDALTRSDLAYFLSTTLSKEPLSNGMNCKDVSETSPFSHSISYVLTQKWMSEFPDGTFRPALPVKKMEFVVSLVKALNLNPELSNMPYFSDIPTDHWSLKFINTGIKAGFVKKESQFSGHESISIKNFIETISQVPTFKNYFVFNEAPIEVSKEEFAYQEHVAAVEKILISLQPKKVEKVEKQEKEAVNPLDIDQIVDIPVKHWARNAVIKLRSLNILPLDKEFHPTKLITRGELLVILPKLYSFTPHDSSIKIKSSGLSEEQLKNLKWLFEKGVFSLESKDPLLSKPLTRLEVLAALIKYIEQFKTIDPVHQIPYQDIPKWGYPYVAKAMSLGILSPSKRFNPKKNMSKAEFACMISKLKFIEENKNHEN